MAAHVMPLANERPRLQNLEIRPRTSSLRILRSPDRLRSGCQYTIGLKLLQSQFRKWTPQNSIQPLSPSIRSVVSRQDPYEFHLKIQRCKVEDKSHRTCRRRHQRNSG